MCRMQLLWPHIEIKTKSTSTRSLNDVSNLERDNFLEDTGGPERVHAGHSFDTEFISPCSLLLFIPAYLNKFINYLAGAWLNLCSRLAKLSGRQIVELEDRSALVAEYRPST